MAEVIGNKIIVNGVVVGTVHEYISSVRRYELGGSEDEK